MNFLLWFLKKTFLWNLRFTMLNSYNVLSALSLVSTTKNILGGSKPAKTIANFGEAATLIKHIFQTVLAVKSGFSSKEIFL